jgi:hypothetical protein
MHIQRMKDWIALIEQTPEIEIDINTFHTPTDISWDRLGTRCIAGHAGVHKLFNEQGFVNKDGWYPTFNGFKGVHAVAQFFEITPNQANWLTASHMYEIGEATKENCLKRMKLILEYAEREMATTQS